jgi:hypothetical protein
MPLPPSIAENLAIDRPGLALGAARRELVGVEVVLGFGAIVLLCGHLAQRPDRRDPRVRLRVGVAGDPLEDLDHLIAGHGHRSFSGRFPL